jgi:ADP-ribose pyrophosphatase YjhB (NUDIX family)
MTHPIKPIATATVVARQHVVLVKYNTMPDHQRGWFLPHDLLNLLEHPTDAAVRALREQLGIELGAAALALKDVESFKGRDGTWHMSFHHVAFLSASSCNPLATSRLPNGSRWSACPRARRCRTTAGRWTRSRK